MNHSFSKQLHTVIDHIWGRCTVLLVIMWVHLLGAAGSTLLKKVP